MSAPGRLVVIGDALLDRDLQGSVERLSPEAPVPVVDERGTESRPGGAGLAAALAARDGHEVTLVTALSGDAPGGELRRSLTGHGVEVIDLGLHGPTPEKVRVRAEGRSLLRLDRGGVGAAKIGPATAVVRSAVDWAAAVLVSDYGRGVAAERGVREALVQRPPRLPVVWDPHPRGPDPPPGILVATPNEGEVARLVPEPSGGGLAEAAARASALRRRWRTRMLCMTRGSGGALLLGESGPPLAAPAPPLEGGDACGAGDRFASSLTGALADGATVEDAVVRAVACASAFVAGGGAGAGLGGEPPSADDAGLGAVERVRAGGGTVVASGGCFDLLHAGHVRMLQAARALGDCLVVCLNSDDSVRSVKGAGRPLVPQGDRAAVLAALRCVDAVVVFDEDTPERVLEGLRPHVWAKGGDYGGLDLPEEETVRRFGGRCVLLPYVEGRSTSRLIEEVAHRVAT